MSNRINSKNPNNNGLAERNITGDDMKRFKNALDSTNGYVSGDKEKSSSSHQFTDKPTKQ